MSVPQSNISSAQYGYDIVVATTSASINSGLMQYLATSDQPVTYICCTADTHGNPDKIYRLQDWLAQVVNINPFDVPAVSGDTYNNNTDIQTLLTKRFLCGFAIQMGLPPGVLPKDLPVPICTLTGDAANVGFNMYYSQFTVIENFPPSGWGQGEWAIYTQDPASLWYTSTTVNLTSQGLDMGLNTPYFNKHPKAKQAILNKLNNISGTGYSLQQLLFDLDNAALQGAPVVGGTIPPTSKVMEVLLQQVIPTWSAQCAAHGQPLLAVNAVKTTQDASPLQLSNMAKECNLYVDGGKPVPYSQESAQEKAVITLNYLGTTGTHTVQPVTGGFTWNWVETSQVDDKSGIMAINRNTFAQFFMGELATLVTPACMIPHAHVSVPDEVVWHVNFVGNVSSGAIAPTGSVLPTGATIIHLTYSNSSSSSDSYQLLSASLNVGVNYNCYVSVSGNTLTVQQNLTIPVSATKDGITASCTAYDMTLTDHYIVTADQNGDLVLQYSSSGPKVDSSSDPNDNPVIDLFAQLNPVLAAVKNAVTLSAQVSLNSIRFTTAQNFIFPGAQVFTYKNAGFSSFQDLVSDITYVAESDDAASDMIQSNAKRSIKASPKNGLGRPMSVVKPLNGTQTRSRKPTSGLVTQNGVHSKTPHPPVSVVNGSTKQTLTMDGVADSDNSHSNVNGDAPNDGNSVSLSPQNHQQPHLDRKMTQLAAKAAVAPASLSLTYSSEMIQNYIQGEVISPQSKFEALQTQDGRSLLIAIDTAGTLNVIGEQNGNTGTGWTTYDLSTAAIQQNSLAGTVQTFDAAQSAIDGTIGLAMAVTSKDSDNLLVCLSNSSSDTSWLSSPSWTWYPFDAQGELRSSIRIMGIFFSETIDKQQYLVVDINRSQSPTVNEISRYYIDSTRKTGSYWIKHDVPIDIGSGNYQTCTGRSYKGYVDGTYTAGTVQGNASGAAQLVYVPLVNAFGNGPPLPIRLNLPNNAVASAIASARNADSTSLYYRTTDLYAISGSSLYYFSAAQQVHDSTVALTIVTSDLLNGTTKLIAMTYGGKTTIWGKNGSDQVYYLSCAAQSASSPAAWSTPTPILSGIESISAYVNKSDGGNTIFASGGTQLKRLIQATDASQLWQAQDIVLAAKPGQPALSFNSYTTTLHLADANNQAVGNTMVSIAASARTSVYIDGLYYVLGSSPISVPTDMTGSITIIEATNNINGTILTISVNGAKTTINPMEETFKKVTALNSTSALRAAIIPTVVVAGGIFDGSKTAPLLLPSTSNTDTQSLANVMTNLSTAYTSSSMSSSPVAAVNGTQALKATARLAFSSGSGSPVAISPGNLFQWLRSGAKAIFQIVKDEASDAWLFLATIGQNVYQAALRTVEAVVGAVEWAFDQVKTVIDDVIQYVKTLFQWDDIRRTKNVFYNISSLYLESGVAAVQSFKAQVDNSIGSVEKTIDQWANITDWAPLGDPAGKPASASGVNPSQGQTSSSQFLHNHFKQNGGQVTVLTSDPVQNPAANLIDDLLGAIDSEDQVLSDVYQQLQDISRQYSSLSLSDVFKKVAAIFADAVLSSAQVVVDAVLNLIADLAATAIDLMTAKIHIPIISDILNEIGISDLSFLDLITWVCAFSYTVVYKLDHDNSPPFANDAVYQGLTSVSQWNDMVAMFQPPSQKVSINRQAASVRRLAAAAPPDQITLPPAAQEQIFALGHVLAGATGALNGFFTFFEASAETGDNDYARLTAVLGATSAIFTAATNHLVPEDPLEQPTLHVIGDILSVTAVIFKIVFAGPVQGKLKLIAPNKLLGLLPDDPRAVGAWVNTVIAFCQLPLSMYHFYELTQKSASTAKTAGCIDETSNLTGLIGRTMYCVAVNDKPPIKAPAVVVATGSFVVQGGLQLGEGGFVPISS